MEKLESNLYTIDEVSRKLKVSSVTVLRWIKQGKIKAIILPSGRIRIPSTEIDRILQGGV